MILNISGERLLQSISVLTGTIRHWICSALCIVFHPDDRNRGRGCFGILILLFWQNDDEAKLRDASFRRFFESLAI